MGRLKKILPGDSDKASIQLTTILKNHYFRKISIQFAFQGCIKLCLFRISFFPESTVFYKLLLLTSSACKFLHRQHMTFKAEKERVSR